MTIQIEALEANNGMLFLARFEDAKITHLFCGFELQALSAPSMREEIEAAYVSVKGWDGAVDDPAEEYRQLCVPYASDLIAHLGPVGYIEYPDLMGAAGLRWAKIEEQDDAPNVKFIEKELIPQSETTRYWFAVDGTEFAVSEGAEIEILDRNGVTLPESADKERLKRLLIVTDEMRGDI